MSHILRWWATNVLNWFQKRLKDYFQDVFYQALMIADTHLCVLVSFNFPKAVGAHSSEGWSSKSHSTEKNQNECKQNRTNFKVQNSLWRMRNEGHCNYQPGDHIENHLKKIDQPKTKSKQVRFLSDFFSFWVAIPSFEEQMFWSSFSNKKLTKYR